MADTLGANLQAQQDFVANASHQFRTPLTGLKLRLEAIKRQGGYAAEQSAKAEGELDRLSMLVDDLLELTQASTSPATGEHVRLDLVATEAVKRWKERAAAEGIALRLDAEAHPVVWADPIDLSHVFDNLIDNGIRYSPRGSEVTVEVSDDHGAPRASVSDTGPGILKEDRERIFERFYRGSSGRRAGAGTGLGLAIVVELVRRWGGRVSLGGGGGTRVEIDLPHPRGEKLTDS